MISLVALFLAGLSFFFTGLNNLKTNLREISSRQFRRLLAKFTHQPVLAALTGLIFGAITQSSTAVSFILSGMITSRLITLPHALPVVAAANIGTSLLVFVATFSVDIPILYLIGITGLLLAFQLTGRFKPIFQILFSIGILFLGLSMMKEAFGPSDTLPGFENFVHFVQAWSFTPFILGIIARVLIQSSSTISVMAITFTASGIFTEYQALLAICGTGPGVALSAQLLSSNSSGNSRQIILFQSIINALSGTFFVLLLLCEKLFHFYPLESVLHTLSASISGRLAWMYCFLMCGCFLFAMLLFRFAPAFLQRLSPATTDQNLAQPAFLDEEMLSLPDVALPLVQQEQFRALQALPDYLAPIQSDTPKSHSGTPSSPSTSLEQLHQASLSLNKEIKHYLQELIQQQLSFESSSDLLQQEKLHDILSSLEQNVYQFTQLILENPPPATSLPLIHGLTEALHTILLTAIDACQSQDPMDNALLLNMTSDRGSLMERLRKSYLQSEASPESRSLILYATSLFERNIWTIRRLAEWLQSSI